MTELYITRKFFLDMVCQSASIVLESAVRKVGTFSNTIGGRSRGVRLGGGLIHRVFEKEGVWCCKWETRKTGSKCENVTQVVFQVTSYGDQQRKKKILTLVRVCREVSNGKW